MLSPLAVGLGFGKAKQAHEEAKQRSAQEEEKRKNSGGSSPANSSGANTPTSSWWKSSSAAIALGAVAALSAAAAGTAYYRREDLALGWRWGYDHMTFVKNLWDVDGLKARLLRIDELSRTRNVLFAK